MKRIFRYCDINRKDKIKELIKPIMSKDLIIIGIGTDLLIGDCLGPMVGQFVKEKTNLKVLGYFGNLVTAKNVSEVQASLDKSKYALAIDSSISTDENNYVEDIVYKDRGVKPGLGVRRELPRTGTHSITGIIKVTEEELSIEEFVSEQIRLETIYTMAKIISEAIIECYQEIVLKK